MRPRRLVVKVHRWTSIALFAWVVIVSLTGAWLVFHNVFEGWLNPGRFDTTEGDVGPQAAVDAAVEEAGGDGDLSFLTLPRNGRGVYQVFLEVPVEGAPAPAEGEEPLHEHVTFFVDPGSAHGQRPRRRHRRGVVVAVPRPHVPVAGLGPVRGVRPGDRLVPRRRRRHRAGRHQGCRLRRAPRRHGHGRLAGRAVHRRAADRLLRLVLAGRAPLGDGAGDQARSRGVRLQHVAAQGHRLRRVGATARRSPSPASPSPSPTSTRGTRTPRRRSATSTCGRHPEDAVSGEADGRERIDLDAALAAIEDALPRPRRAVADAAVRRDLDLLGVGHPRVRPVDTRGRRRQRLRRPRPVHRRRSSTTAHPKRATSSISCGTTGTSRCTPATSAARSRGSLWTAPGPHPGRPRGHRHHDVPHPPPQAGATAAVARTSA